MATFDTLESSEQLSKPIELYVFSIGGDTYEFTSHERDVTVGGTLYSAEALLERTSAKKGRDSRKQPMEIRLPAANEFASQWRVRPPGLSGSVTILRVQRDETPSIGTTQVLEFKGTVRGVDFPGDGKTAVMTVASIEQSANRTVPRFAFTALCNHFLYDLGCGVDPDLHKLTSTVTVESANVITVPGASGFPDGTFAAGYVKPPAVNDFRLVIDHTGDVLTLDLPFKNSVVGLAVDAFKGCDHKIDGDCQNVFANQIEHGGFPFRPPKNPFTTRIG